MTLKEISQYYELRQKLTRYSNSLIALKSAAEKMTSRLDGMPRNGNGIDNVSYYVERIIQLEEKIESKNEELMEAKQEALDYISKIEDSYMQTVFLLRFIECMSWGDIAISVGNEGAADSIRMACYRYLDNKY